MTDRDDPEEFRTLAHTVVDWIADYRAGIETLPVQPQVQPGSVRSALPPLPEQPQPFKSLLDELDTVIVPASTHWQSPSFFAYFPANASLHSLLGDMLSGGLGTQGMLRATSPACTETEQHLMDELAAAMALPAEFTFAGGGGGTIEDSASSSSLVALFAALHRAHPDWLDRGVHGDERVYVSAETHSSLAKAVRLAGLGARSLVVVDAEPGGHGLSPDALDAAMTADLAAGLRPVLVCPTIGTRSTATCWTGSSWSTRSAPMRTSGCSRLSTRHCCGCATPKYCRPRSR